MTTDALSPSAETFAHAATLLQAGQLIVLPTDTVYGIAAAAFSTAAIEKLYAAKERPRTKGLPILVSDVAQLARVAIVPDNERITDWLERFWPGPLTLIFERHPDLPSVISPNGGIAVRLPDHEMARAIIRQAGGAVASSSANLSGAAPATTAGSVSAQLAQRVAAVVDGGQTPGGVPSTIVDCTFWPPRIVREGPITAEQLQS